MSIPRRAHILIEALMVLTVLAALLPVFYGWMIRELKANQQLTLAQETDRQIDFTQQYLQSVCSQSHTASVTSELMNIVTSKDSYEVGLRKDAVYVRRDAYRYLTTDPVKVTQLQFTILNEKLCLVTLQANQKPYRFQLML